MRGVYCRSLGLVICNSPQRDYILRGVQRRGGRQAGATVLSCLVRRCELSLSQSRACEELTSVASRPSRELNDASICVTRSLTRRVDSRRQTRTCFTHVSTTTTHTLTPSCTVADSYLRHSIAATSKERPFNNLQNSA